MEIINVGTAAFWIMFAGIVIAGHWFRVRSEALRHETLRQIIERTGQIDETQLKAFIQPPTPGWFREPAPGTGYRALRVLGTVVMAVALGLTVFFSIYYLSSPARHDSALLGFASASLIAMIGIGFFYASRFLAPPSDRRDHI